MFPRQGKSLRVLRAVAGGAETRLDVEAVLPERLLTLDQISAHLSNLRAAGKVEAFGEARFGRRGRLAFRYRATPRGRWAAGQACPTGPRVTRSG